MDVVGTRHPDNPLFFANLAAGASRLEKLRHTKRPMWRTPDIERTLVNPASVISIPGWGGA
ncbi:MAG TPA: hypothetical protein VKB16_09835 [Beijerinckiaceae bacterium]|nr:hypothetical protein [Beijerinckiaceae bacterium]